LKTKELCATAVTQPGEMSVYNEYCTALSLKVFRDVSSRNRVNCGKVLGIAVKG
jgi:hypothetical protein